MDKNRRRKILALAAMVLMLANLGHSKKHTPQYEILADEATLAFASYSGGLIYIGSATLLESIEPRENDILVLDQRDAKDPNMKIIDSYKVGDTNTKGEILQVLLEYEAMYPSNWNRSYDSMLEEWGEHDTLYDWNYQTHRTADVDLNNADENKYKRFYRFFRKGYGNDRN